MSILPWHCSFWAGYAYNTPPLQMLKSAMGAYCVLRTVFRASWCARREDTFGGYKIKIHANEGVPSFVSFTATAADEFLHAETCEL